MKKTFWLIIVVLLVMVSGLTPSSDSLERVVRSAAALYAPAEGSVNAGVMRFGSEPANHFPERNYLK